MHWKLPTVLWQYRFCKSQPVSPVLHSSLSKKNQILIIYSRQSFYIKHIFIFSISVYSQFSDGFVIWGAAEDLLWNQNEDNNLVF